MSTTVRSTLARAALLAATLGLAAGAAQATRDLTIPIGTCPPANATTLQADLKLTNGAVRKPGRDPPGRSSYFCGLPIDDLAASPGWNTFEFQFIDRNLVGDGNLRARLMRRSLATGATATVASLVSVPSATLRTVKATLVAPLDYTRNVYFVIVDMEAPSQPVELHTVRLTTR